MLRACFPSGVKRAVRMCAFVCEWVRVSRTREEKAWEWITVEEALRKALKRSIPHHSLQELMFSPECVLPSCFLSLSSHQGDGFFLTSFLSAVVISWSSCSGDLAGVSFTSQTCISEVLNSRAWKIWETHPPPPSLCDFTLGLSPTMLSAGAWLTPSCRVTGSHVRSPW